MTLSLENADSRPAYKIPFGYLSAIDIRVTGGTAEYRRPRHAADRTRSRRRLAGSRRARRYGVPAPGPSGQPARDYPCNTITGFDLFNQNRYGGRS